VKNVTIIQADKTVPKFTSAVFFVKEIARSRAFYTELLGQKVTMDYGRCVVLEGGLAIWQEEYAWEVVFGKKPPRATPGKNIKAEIAFEIEDIDSLWKRLIDAGVQVTHPVREQPWGQQVGRVYDPDGHLVEFGEPMWVVVRRLAAQGLPPEEIAPRTSMPLPIVKNILHI
jgi:catechol 2,3-dioxygenase-like lactoylglutathione lyase family enzyme